MSRYRDVMEHSASSMGNPAAFALVPLGLWSGASRYRRNYRTCRRQWETLVQHSYTRPAPAEDNTAFWACLRRAIPNALTDKSAYDRAVANTGAMYLAATESTVIAIATTLMLLALDEDTSAALVQACCPSL